MSWFRKLLRSWAESDEERLDEELSEWSRGIDGTVPMAEAPLRRRVKLAGAVKRITVLPGGGLEALEVTLTDGTGEVVSRWLGRRSIPGLAIGSRLVVEGVLGEEGGVRRMVNCTFELVPAPSA